MSQQSSPAWRSSIVRQLGERNRVSGDGFATLIQQHNTWLFEIKAASANNSRLEQENRLLQARCEQLEKQAADGGGASSAAQQDETRKLQSELNESSKLNSQIAKQILELNEQLKQASEVYSIKVSELSEMKNILQSKEIKLQKAVGENASRGQTVELVKGELLQLQVALVNSEERVQNLTKENKGLVDRWMKKVAEDVGKMNEANKFFREVNATASLMESQAKAAAASTHSSSSGLDMDDFLLTEGAKPVVPIGQVPLPTGHRKHFSASSAEINALAFNKSGSTMVTGGTDKIVKVWDTHTGTLKANLMGAERTIMSVAVSPLDDLVMAASNDNATRIWSLELGRVRHSLLGHMGKVYSAEFSYDGQQAITGSHDRTLKIWDLQKGYCMRTIFCFSSCNDLAFSHDGAMVVSGHLDHRLRLWDVKNGELVHEIANAHSAQITSVSFHPDGNSILSASRDHTLSLIDRRMHQVLHTYKNEQFQNGLSWTRATLSPDGRFVACGSANGTIFVWNTATAKLETTLVKHKTTVPCVTWGPTHMASSDRAGFICTW